MKPPRHNQSAFTMTELAVVVAVVALLMVIFIPAQMQGKIKMKRNTCVNNLKLISVGYRVWAQNSDYPTFEANEDGGWRTTIINPNAESLIWTNYFLLKDAGLADYSPQTLICPADERKRAVDFTISNFNSNTNISYFVGAHASDNHPTSFLGGDRNLAGSAKDKTYGYSPVNGLGFDTATIPLRTNATNFFWSRQMHSAGNSEGAGNLLLGDGSVQQPNSDGLRKFLNQCQDNGSFSNGVVRLLLP